MADILAHDAKLRALLAMLRAISTRSITRTEMEIMSGLSRATLMRLLRTARQVFCVEIIFMRQPAPGHYKITNWGLLNRNKILKG